MLSMSFPCSWYVHSCIKHQALLPKSVFLKFLGLEVRMVNEEEVHQLGTGLVLRGWRRNKEN